MSGDLGGDFNETVAGKIEESENSVDDRTDSAGEETNSEQYSEQLDSEGVDSEGSDGERLHNDGFESDSYGVGSDSERTDDADAPVTQFAFVEDCLDRECCERDFEHRLGMKTRVLPGAEAGVQAEVKAVCILSGNKGEDCGQYVVKVFDDEYSDWLTEIETMTWLRDRYSIKVPQIHDVWHCDDVYYIIMDRLQGNTLYRMIKRNEVIPKKALVGLAQTVWRIHWPEWPDESEDLEGVNHLDLHLNNVMYHEPESAFYLIDFGKAVKKTYRSQRRRVKATFADQICLYEKLLLLLASQAKKGNVANKGAARVLRKEWNKLAEEYSVKTFTKMRSNLTKLPDCLNNSV